MRLDGRREPSYLHELIRLKNRRLIFTSDRSDKNIYRIVRATHNLANFWSNTEELYQYYNLQ